MSWRVVDYRTHHNTGTRAYKLQDKHCYREVCYQLGSDQDAVLWGALHDEVELDQWYVLFMETNHAACTTTFQIKNIMQGNTIPVTVADLDHGLSYKLLHEAFGSGRSIWYPSLLQPACKLSLTQKEKLARGLERFTSQPDPRPQSDCDPDVPTPTLADASRVRAHGTSDAQSTHSAAIFVLNGPLRGQMWHSPGEMFKHIEPVMQPARIISDDEKISHPFLPVEETTYRVKRINIFGSVMEVAAIEGTESSALNDLGARICEAFTKLGPVFTNFQLSLERLSEAAATLAEEMEHDRSYGSRATQTPNETYRRDQAAHGQSQPHLQNPPRAHAKRGDQSCARRSGRDLRRVRERLERNRSSQNRDRGSGGGRTGTVGDDGMNGYWLCRDTQGRVDGPFTTKSLPLTRAEKKGPGWYVEFPDGSEVRPRDIDIMPCENKPDISGGMWVRYKGPDTFVESVHADTMDLWGGKGKSDYHNRVLVITDNGNFTMFDISGSSWRKIQWFLYITNLPPVEEIDL